MIDPPDAGFLGYCVIAMGTAFGAIGTWVGLCILVPIRDGILEHLKFIQGWLLTFSKDVSETKTHVVELKEVKKDIMDLKAFNRCPVFTAQSQVAEDPGRRSGSHLPTPSSLG